MHDAWATVAELAFGGVEDDLAFMEGPSSRCQQNVAVIRAPIPHCTSSQWTALLAVAAESGGRPRT